MKLQKTCMVLYFCLANHCFLGPDAVGRCEHSDRQLKWGDADSLFQGPTSIGWLCTRLGSLWPSRQAEFPLLCYATSQGMQKLTFSFPPQNTQHSATAAANWGTPQNNGLRAIVGDTEESGPMYDKESLHTGAASPSSQGRKWVCLPDRLWIGDEATKAVSSNHRVLEVIYTENISTWKPISENLLVPQFNDADSLP